MFARQPVRVPLSALWRPVGFWGSCLLLVRGVRFSSLRLRQRIHSLSPLYWVPHLRPRSPASTELLPASVQPGLIKRLISRTGCLLLQLLCVDSHSRWFPISDHPGLVYHLRFRKSVAWRPWMPPACWLAVSQLNSHRLSIGSSPWPLTFPASAADTGAVGLRSVPPRY
ncbi:hypothetical protein M440DRAFT_269182 [Trichoderma longibrachiatum ATCC 18648]|uniref:Uncharacterized protein n=1 Tax=Trichoderma longibrachiatum ATCC 18648 TaxID=983965 RepID=A0A2T4CB23_TRILO|nr:hypothetical protein M440DRAFT_269182 [Trichoderma longibrachiatum ATCC 18648]